MSAGVSISLGFVTSLLVWWLLALGPFRDTRLFDLDRSLGDTVLRLGTDQRSRPGPSVYLVAFDQGDWETAGMPAETPPKALAKMLLFARRSEAKLVLLDIDLLSRSAVRGPGALEPAIVSELQDWDSDDHSPLLLLADSQHSARLYGDAPANLVAPMRRIAITSATVEAEANGIVRHIRGWTCTGPFGPTPSPIAFLAALSGGVEQAKTEAIARTRQACDEKDTRLTLRGNTVREREPIFFHLSGKSAAPTDDGKPGYDGIALTELAAAIDRGPQSRRCGPRLVYFENTCGSLLIIGATHAGTGDKMLTPLAPFEPDATNPSVAINPHLDGAVVIGNALRGYSTFGPMTSMPLVQLVPLLLGCVIGVYIVFVVWQLPGRKLARLRRGRKPWKRLLGRFDWIFGAVVAKLVATAVWSFALVIFYYNVPTWANGPGLIAASYAAAFTFAVREVQDLAARRREGTA
jgi:hypothetical protein